MMNWKLFESKRVPGVIQVLFRLCLKGTEGKGKVKGKIFPSTGLGGP
jgi:hypothetical protein